MISSAGTVIALQTGLTGNSERQAETLQQKGHPLSWHPKAVYVLAHHSYKIIWHLNSLSDNESGTLDEICNIRPARNKHTLIPGQRTGSTFGSSHNQIFGISQRHQLQGEIDIS